jgi:putative transposase
VAAFIAAQRDARRIPHGVSCRALGVSQSWFYKWRHHARAGTLPPRAARRARLAAEVKRLFESYEGKRGSPVVTADLQDAGWRVSENTVAALMREQNLVARPKRRRKATTRPGRGRWRAPDLVKRDFPAARLNQKWYGDGTEISTGEGKLYLASVMDAASRRVLGFTLSEHHNAAAAYGALAMAITVRGGTVPGVIMHTDQGSEYTARAFQARVRPRQRGHRIVALHPGVRAAQDRALHHQGSCPRQGGSLDRGLQHQAAALRLRALLLTGDDTDRRAARKALSKTALAVLAGRQLPAHASREHAIRQAEITRLALALAQARCQLTDNRSQPLAIVNDIAPGRTSRYGVGPVSAAQAIVSFSHPGRCRNEAAFAALGGTSPIPASSGHTIRHRLNRGGDRALNRAIPTITLTRIRSCPRTRAYVARRTAGGKTAREIRRRLKRYIARELYRQLNQSMKPLTSP